MMYGKADLDAALYFTASQIKRSGFTLKEFDDENNDNGHGGGQTAPLHRGKGEGERAKQWVLQHDMGLNGSIFFKSYIGRLVNNGGYAIKIELMTDNLLAIKIQEPSVIKAKQ